MTANSSSQVRWTLVARAHASVDWDQFLKARPNSPLYVQKRWVDLASDVFGHRTTFLEARDSDEQLVGVLPIVQQRSILVGNFATSVPFFNYGGAEAQTQEIAQLLMERARDIAFEWGCKYVEFRDSQHRPGNWRVRTDKVTMILDLPDNFDALAKRLGSKLRSQVKRSERESVVVRTGGVELVKAFYEVFAENMRDLGTPVYPRAFFEEIVNRFPDACRILVIESNSVAVAAGFLVFSGQRAEIPWAGCKSAAKPLGFNMKLYWEVLRRAIESGCTSFDFGRSTVDGGTYRFKRQWGAEPVQLFWHRWERGAPISDDVPVGASAMERASQLWRRLPLPIANTLGPWLSPKLPW